MTRWWGWPAARRSSYLRTPTTLTPSTGRWPRTASCTTSTTSWSTAGGWSSTRERSTGSQQAAGSWRPSPSTTKRRDCKAVRGGRGQISGETCTCSPAACFTCNSSLLQPYLIYLYLMLFISHWEFQGISHSGLTWTVTLNGDSDPKSDAELLLIYYWRFYKIVILIFF